MGGDEGRALWFLDGLIVWKALGADTAGRYELVEQQGAGGYAAPLHTHAGETEGFYVVQGDLTMVNGDLRFRAGRRRLRLRTDGRFARVSGRVAHGHILITPP
ncbi:MAG TPA: hypothetical protein VK821_20085, partial [Dehalococcoidia bacterium]|nr:hypothetical protein [Dehalococcoidia bacterium]